MLAYTMVLLVRYWPPFTRYMIAYSTTVQRQQLEELTASLQAIEHAGFVRGVATCKRALLPEQEVNDA